MLHAIFITLVVIAGLWVAALVATFFFVLWLGPVKTD